MTVRLGTLWLAVVASWCWNHGITGDVQQPPHFQTRVEAVVLDVSVLGRDGLPVRGLSAADFTVLEDGRPQPVSTFTLVDLSGIEATAPGWLRNAPLEAGANDDVAEGAIYVVLVDDVMTEPIPARVQQCARLVLDALRPRDLAAVVFLANKRAGQAFTRDRSRLLAAVERYRGPMGGSALPALAPRMLVDTLADLADGLSALPSRRKAVIYIGAGLPIDLGSGMPTSLNWQEILRAHDTGAFVHLLLRLFERARRANVTVYGLDPSGLSAAHRSVEQDFLRTLAQNTGGFVVTDTNDPQSGVAQILRENSSYYLLGYQPTNQRTEGRFRRIEVRVNRPDVTVRTRSGYIEPSRAQVVTQEAPASALETALSGLLPKQDVSIRLTAAPVALWTRKQAALAIVVSVQPGRDAASPPGTAEARARADLDVLVRAYDMDGHLQGSERLHARVPPSAAAGEPCEVLSRLDLHPGRYQLRVAATLRGKTGSIFHDVDVPDFAASRLALSGVAVTAAPAVPSSPNERLLSLLPVPVVPTARRDFSVADRVSAFLYVYQSGSQVPAPVMMSSRIADAMDTKVFEAVHTLDASLFTTARAAGYRLDLPLASLQPGSHLLSIEAAAGGIRARRDIQFTVHEPR